MLLFLPLFAAAGCAGPRHGPMTPLNTARSFGYQESRIGPDQWEVTYFGIVRRLSTDAEQEPQVQSAIQRSRELALWRAAQIALARGRPSFDVEQERVDTRVHRQPGSYRYPLHHYPHHYRHRHLGGYPWGYPYPWGYTYDPPTAHGRAWVTLRVRLRRDSGGRVNARTWQARMRSRYGHEIPPPTKAKTQ